jgi:hypothetical protein
MLNRFPMSRYAPMRLLRVPEPSSFFVRRAMFPRSVSAHALARDHASGTHGTLEGAEAHADALAKRVRPHICGGRCGPVAGSPDGHAFAFLVLVRPDGQYSVIK